MRSYCTHAYVFVCVGVCVRVCVGEWVCLWVCVYECVCECVCMGASVIVCHIEGKWESVWVFVMVCVGGCVGVWVCVMVCVCLCVCVLSFGFRWRKKKFILLSYQVLYVSSHPLYKLASSKENPFFIKSLNNQKTLRKKLFDLVLIYKVILIIVFQQKVIYKLSNIVNLMYLYLY